MPPPAHLVAKPSAMGFVDTNFQPSAVSVRSPFDPVFMAARGFSIAAPVTAHDPASSDRNDVAKGAPVRDNRRGLPGPSSSPWPMVGVQEGSNASSGRHFRRAAVPPGDDEPARGHSSRFPVDSSHSRLRTFSPFVLAHPWNVQSTTPSRSFRAPLGGDRGSPHAEYDGSATSTPTGVLSPQVVRALQSPVPARLFSGGTDVDVTADFAKLSLGSVSSRDRAAGPAGGQLVQLQIDEQESRAVLVHAAHQARRVLDDNHHRSATRLSLNLYHDLLDRLIVHESNVRCDLQKTLLLSHVASGGQLRRTFEQRMRLVEVETAESQSRRVIERQAFSALELVGKNVARFVSHEWTASVRLEALTRLQAQTESLNRWLRLQVPGPIAENIFMRRALQNTF